MILILWAIFYGVGNQRRPLQELDFPAQHLTNVPKCTTVRSCHHLNGLCELIFYTTDSAKLPRAVRVHRLLSRLELWRLRDNETHCGA